MYVAVSQGSVRACARRRRARARRTYREPRRAGGVERGETRVFNRAILKPRARGDGHVASRRAASTEDECGARRDLANCPTPGWRMRARVRAVDDDAIARGGARGRDRGRRGVLLRPGRGARMWEETRKRGTVRARAGQGEGPGTLRSWFTHITNVRAMLGSENGVEIFGY